jgi:hypothetical protein
MKYTPSLPEHNDNVTQEHPLKDFLLILGALAALALLVFFLLGLLIDAVVDRMEPGAEAALTRIVAANMPAGPARPDPRQAQLQALVDSLRPCIALAGPAQVRLTDSTTPNAMVVPGGTMVVFSGLLQHVKSENGLAFVLAHELAHLAHRDHLRALGGASCCMAWPRSSRATIRRWPACCTAATGMSAGRPNSSPRCGASTAAAFPVPTMSRRTPRWTRASPRCMPPW